MTILKPPRLRDDSLLADIAAARREPDRLHLWWLGQSGFLVQWQGRHLLLDPYLSDSLTAKYAQTDKPHVRMTDRVIAPARLDFIDIVTSSHNHTDHLDRETLIALWNANPQVAIVVPAANQAFAAERLGVELQRLTPIDEGQAVACSGFTLHAVPAAHETVERDELGRCRFLGLVVRCGPWTLYHSGDTIRYEGMAERLRPWLIDVAILPVNGRSPERRVAGNLWGHEAAQLARDIGAGVLIPCHYDMFRFNTESPDACVAECERQGQSVAVLENGQRWSSSLPAV